MLGEVVDVEAREVRAGTVVVAAQIGDGVRQQFLAGSWDALGELVGSLPQVRATAAKVPYFAW